MGAVTLFVIVPWFRFHYMYNRSYNKIRQGAAVADVVYTSGFESKDPSEKKRLKDDARSSQRTRCQTAWRAFCKMGNDLAGFPSRLFSPCKDLAGKPMPCELMLNC